MRIEYNYNKVIKHVFSDVKQGDIFRCGGIYIKIEPIFDESSDETVNAVNLENGENVSFSDNTEICFMPKTFLDVRD